VPQNTTRNQTMQLPSIEGQIIIPKYVDFGVDILDAGEDQAVSLSHWLDHPPPVSASDMFDDETVWLWHNYDGAGAVHIDLTSLEIKLAGPQVCLFWNGVSATRVYGISMWYDTITVPLIEWANLMRITSFEDI